MPLKMEFNLLQHPGGGLKEQLFAIDRCYAILLIGETIFVYWPELDSEVHFDKHENEEMVEQAFDPTQLNIVSVSGTQSICMCIVFRFQSTVS